MGAKPTLPEDLQSAAASPDDRNMAMIAHLLGLVGFLGPLILYLVKKDTASRFVKFHALQSLWFQVAVMVAAFAVGIVGGALSFVTAGLGVCLLVPLILIVTVGAVVYAIIGAVTVSKGNDFEYYWIGPWVRQSLAA
jgi:hypothetical protein